MIQNKSKDYIFNILASVIIVGTLQLGVYPYIARVESPTKYGEVLLIMAIVNIMVLAFGNTLNNIRLIINTEYEEKAIVGDFNLLLITVSAVSFVGTLLVSSMYLQQSITNSIIIALTVVLGVIRTYFCVEYRLKINFSKILSFNLALSGAYLIGTYTYGHSKLPWIWIFLIAEMIAAIYLLKNLEFIYQEAVLKTELFKNTSYKYLSLIAIGMLANILVYIDRIIIYPLLGAEVVAIYFCASFLGKSIGVVVGPISGVLLSYYAQSSYVMDRKRFFYNVGMYSLVCAAAYIALQITGDYFVSLLYPNLYVQAKPYVWIGNLAAIIWVLSSMINPAILRYISLKLQFVAQIAYFIVYIGLCYVLTSEFQLMGFCYAIVIANLLKLATQLWMGYRYIGADS